MRIILEPPASLKRRISFRQSWPTNYNVSLCWYSAEITWILDRTYQNGDIVAAAVAMQAVMYAQRYPFTTGGGGACDVFRWVPSLVEEVYLCGPSCMVLYVA